MSILVLSTQQNVQFAESEFTSNTLNYFSTRLFHSNLMLAKGLFIFVLALCLTIFHKINIKRD
jgi:hypothetical protein